MLHTSLTGTLTQWGVSNNDLFYVFVRREDQPDVASPQALPTLDHNSGKHLYCKCVSYITTYISNMTKFYACNVVEDNQL